jgi:GTP-binding protein EngB required for normal cell division
MKRLFILIDSRIGPRDSDMELMNFCDLNGISYQVVYTKKDKRQREPDQVILDHMQHPAMVADILETSAEKKYGIDKIRAIIGIK